MANIYHLFSILVTLIALYYSYKVKKLFGRIYAKSFAFVIVAIIFLLLSHFVEFFFKGSAEESIEQLLFSAGMFSLTISFIVLLWSLGKYHKA